MLQKKKKSAETFALLKNNVQKKMYKFFFQNLLLIQFSFVLSLQITAISDKQNYNKDIQKLEEKKTSTKETLKFFFQQ